LDDELLREARSALNERQLADLTREAAEDLASFRERMAPDAFVRARDGAVARLLREQLGLPTLTFA
jgi:hypothetical protein